MQSPLKSAAQVQQQADLNPEKKTLSPEQWQQLEELVERCNREREPLYDRMWSLRKDAMIRSARLGRFDVESYGAPASMLPADLQEHVSEGEQSSSALDGRIAEKLGVAQQDWRFTKTSTSAPDGVSKQVVTWFTRDQEPEFFSAEALEREAVERHRQAFRDFFANVR